MSEQVTQLWLERTSEARDAWNTILVSSGFNAARIYYLEDVQKKLSGTPVDVQSYFDEAIVCLKNDLVRSAIVVSWAGFFSLFCEKLYAGKSDDILAVRKKWIVGSSLELKEAAPEAQIIEVAKELGFIKNPKRRMLDGWLSQRNQCAHPTVYKPTQNVGIGFVDSMIEETLELLK